MLDIDACAEGLAQFIANSQPRISGPHETAYGIGWEPTISYWIGQRRVHLYEDLSAKSAPEPFAVEIADRTRENRVVQRCYVTKVDQVRDILDRFLSQQQPVDALSDYEWICDGLDHDKGIHDPPNRREPGNLAEFVGGHLVPGGPPPLERPASWRKPWWKFW